MIDTDIHTMLKEHEGVEKFPYVDTVGKMTIGIGRNLTDVGLSEEEINFLLRNDLINVEQDLRRNGLWIDNYTFDERVRIRQAVLIDMCFNLGINKLLKFRNTIKAIHDENWKLASMEMLDSKWAEQVGNRAIRLSKMMEHGAFVDKWW
jgi:lysozyme